MEVYRKYPIWPELIVNFHIIHYYLQILEDQPLEFGFCCRKYRDGAGTLTFLQTWESKMWVWVQYLWFWNWPYWLSLGPLTSSTRQSRHSAMFSVKIVRRREHQSLLLSRSIKWFYWERLAPVWSVARQDPDSVWRHLEKALYLLFNSGTKAARHPSVWPWL